jgi:hypothetical protein
MKFLVPLRLMFFFLFILHFSVILRSSAQENQAGIEKSFDSNFLVSPACSRIKIDGIIDEEAWQKAVKIPLPFEWYPGDNIPAPVETECMITYNRSNLYFAFRCFDPEPAKIRAHLMNRDEINTFVQDDYVSVMIDTFNDERRSFQFRVNPLGVQADAFFSELEGYEDFSWDAIWTSAGIMTDVGYTIEIAIPFNQLRFPKDKAVKTWGFEAERSYPRSHRHRCTTHITNRDISCILCQFNKIKGFKNISPGRNLEFDPTLTINRTDKRGDFPIGEIETGKIKIEPGITAKWGISPNLILNAAVNPDFSQVEADAAQLEVNTRFALRYPEKRPFFLEGADFFLTPIEAVFTRTVYDPAWGIKSTGKVGKNAIGFFTAQDNYNNLIFPSNQGSGSTSVKEDVFSGVFRYRRDVGKGSTIGALYTGRSGDEYLNHTAGIDAFLRISKTKTMTFQYIHSQTGYPDEIASNFNQPIGSFPGDALFIQFKHFGRNAIYFIEYEDLSPGFRADYGFIPRVDTKRIEASVEPRLWGKKNGWFSKISFGITGKRITYHDNTLTNQDIQLFFKYWGPLQTYFQPGFTRKKELYGGITFDMNVFQASFNVKPTGGLNLSLSSRYGDTIDYSNSRLASSLLINPGIELGLGKHFNMNLDHIFERLSLEGDSVYTANLFQARLVYNLNVRTFIRAIVQYTHISRDIDLYIFPVDPLTRKLFIQFLFSYKLNPQTVLFIGYSDNHLGEKGIDLTRTDRTFFLKIGYALVM